MTIYVQPILKTSTFTQAIEVEENPLDTIASYEPIPVNFEGMGNKELFDKLKLGKGNDDDKAKYKSLVTPKKEKCQYMVEGENKGMTRNNKNLLHTNLIKLDFDDGTLSLDDLKAKFNGIDYVIYPTFNYGYLGERWRVWLRADRPYTQQEIKALYVGLKSTFDLGLDDKALDDTSKTWSQPQGLPVMNDIARERGLGVVRQEGEPVSVDSMLELGRLVETKSKTTPKKEQKRVQNIEGFLPVVHEWLEIHRERINSDYKEFEPTFLVIANGVKHGEISREDGLKILDILAEGNEYYMEQNRLHFDSAIADGGALIMHDKSVFQWFIDGSKTWWRENENGTHTLLHAVLGKLLLEQHKIVHYPTINDSLHYYDAKTGLYVEDKRGQAVKHMIRSMDEERLRDVHVREVFAYIDQMASVVEKKSDDYIALGNGLYNLNTFEFEPFTPNVFKTEKLGTNYNPQASSEFVDTLLKKVTDGVSESIENLKEMMACIVYPNVLIPRMWYLYGRSANNGKSTLLNLIQNTFNPDFTNFSAVDPSKLALNTHASASLYGKLANIVDDLPDLYIEDTGKLKTIVSGGFVDIEKKFQDARTVRITATLIFASNHFPRFKESGNQIDRRMHIIPFDHDFGTDPDALSDFETRQALESVEAREYTLKLALETLERMLKGDAKEMLTYNPTAENALKRFSEYSDPLSEFFENYTLEQILATPPKELYQAYSFAVADEGTKVLGKPKFYLEVERRFNVENKPVKDKQTKKTVRKFVQVKKN